MELLSKIGIFQDLAYSTYFSVFWIMLEIIQMSVLAPILLEDRNQDNTKRFPISNFFTAAFTSLFRRLQMIGFNIGVNAPYTKAINLSISCESIAEGFRYEERTVPQNKTTTDRWAAHVEKALLQPFIELILRMLERMDTQEIKMSRISTRKKYTDHQHD